MQTQKLTGKWYLRKTIFGYVLMVETVQSPGNGKEVLRWKKARQIYLVQLGFKSF